MPTETRDSRIKIGSRWKHLKTGGIYRVSGECVLEATWRRAVLYVKIDENPLSTPPQIARDAEEFFDGRFIEIEPQ